MLPFVSEHHRQIRYAVDARSTAIQVWSEGRTGERRISAVTRACNTHAAGSSDALLDHRLDAVGDVVLHQPAPLAVARHAPGLAEAGGAAKLRLKYGVTARREKLRPPIERLRVAGFRAAVRENHQRQVCAGR